MATYYLNIGLTYIVIGFAITLWFYYVLRRPFLGRFWGALVLGLIGAFLGGVVDFYFDDLIHRLANLNNVNIFPPLITSFILMWVFSAVTDSDR